VNDVKCVMCFIYWSSEHEPAELFSGLLRASDYDQHVRAMRSTSRIYEWVPYDMDHDERIFVNFVSVTVLR